MNDINDALVHKTSVLLSLLKVPCSSSSMTLTDWICIDQSRCPTRTETQRRFLLITSHLEEDFQWMKVDQFIDWIHGWIIREPRPVGSCSRYKDPEFRTFTSVEQWAGPHLSASFMYSQRSAALYSPWLENNGLLCLPQQEALMGLNFTRGVDSVHERKVSWRPSTFNRPSEMNHFQRSHSSIPQRKHSSCSVGGGA